MHFGRNDNGLSLGWVSLSLPLPRHLPPVSWTCPLTKWAFFGPILALAGCPAMPCPFRAQSEGPKPWPNLLNFFFLKLYGLENGKKKKKKKRRLSLVRNTMVTKGEEKWRRERWGWSGEGEGLVRWRRVRLLREWGLEWGWGRGRGRGRAAERVIVRVRESDYG